MTVFCFAGKNQQAKVLPLRSPFPSKTITAMPKLTSESRFAETIRTATIFKKSRNFQKKIHQRRSKKTRESNRRLKTKLFQTKNTFPNKTNRMKRFQKRKLKYPKMCRNKIEKLLQSDMLKNRAVLRKISRSKSLKIVLKAKS